MSVMILILWFAVGPVFFVHDVMQLFHDSPPAYSLIGCWVVWGVLSYRVLSWFTTDRPLSWKIEQKLRRMEQKKYSNQIKAAKQKKHQKHLRRIDWQKNNAH